MQKETINDLIIGALEGGSNYWYDLPDLSMVEYFPVIRLPIMDRIIAAINDGAIIPVQDVETHEHLGEISLTNIKRAVKLMHDNHPHHYADAITGDHDAITSDIFLQLIVMGELVYG